MKGAVRLSQCIAAILLVACMMIGLSACASIGMKHLPEGEYMESAMSPDGSYQVRAYLVNGGATVDWAVRCEVVTVSTGKVRNLYWEYRCNTAEIRWIDEVTVEINGIQLDVRQDSYDWRNN